MNAMTHSELTYLAAEIARRTEPFLTIAKLAQETGLSQGAIRKKCQRGEFPFHRQGRLIVFYRSELNEKIREESR